uniref:DDE Tnp4 domain-containing protein n=1 Tax=Cyprinus carpio carpio TaxID=630221 RepID=A0A9J8D5P7_CYPCA
MSTHTSQLLAMVEPFITKTDTVMKRSISAKERLSVTLRFLATGVSFKSLGFQFRIGSTTIGKIVEETCELCILNVVLSCLQTSTSEEQWRKIAEQFDMKWQFPHCLGAIDGKHIFIQPPANSGSTFYNYKFRFSVLLMAVVDANYRFIYTNVGDQGRVSDTGLFAQSDLQAALDDRKLNLPPAEALLNTNIIMPYCFVGDEVYPLRNDLLKPYPHRRLQPEQRIFNYRLSRARCVVENAFGILANRLRVFHTTICLNPDKAVTVTLAALCLHNFLRHKQSDAYLPPGYTDWEGENHQLHDGAWRQERTLQSVNMGGGKNPTITAKEQRDHLKEYFVSPAGCVPWQDQYV